MGGGGVSGGGGDGSRQESVCGWTNAGGSARAARGAAGLSGQPAVRGGMYCARGPEQRRRRNHGHDEAAAGTHAKAAARRGAPQSNRGAGARREQRRGKASKGGRGRVYTYGGRAAVYIVKQWLMSARSGAHKGEEECKLSQTPALSGGAALVLLRALSFPFQTPAEPSRAAPGRGRATGIANRRRDAAAGRALLFMFASPGAGACAPGVGRRSAALGRPARQPAPERARAQAPAGVQSCCCGSCFRAPNLLGRAWPSRQGGPAARGAGAMPGPRVRGPCALPSQQAAALGRGVSTPASVDHKAQGRQRICPAPSGAPQRPKYAVGARARDGLAPPRPRRASLGSRQRRTVQRDGVLCGETHGAGKAG